MVHLLSSGLQFTDLEPSHKVILAHTLTQVGLSNGVQFGGWHCKVSEILIGQEYGAPYG